MDSLTHELISQFVKANRDKKTKSETTIYGTAVEYNGHTYVRLDGSDLLTPVEVTADLRAGERVTVMVKNHTATVTGNLTSPAARTGDVADLAATVDDQNNQIVRQGNNIVQIGNDISQINNAITQQNNTIVQIGNSIKQQENEIVEIGNRVTQQGNVVVQMGNTVAQQGNTITQIDNHITEQGNDISILNSAFVIQDGKLIGLTQIVVDDLETEHLSAHYAEIDMANVNNAWIENGVIKKASITDEQVLNISANKLTAGTIDASKINVVNLNADNLTVGTINGQRIGQGTLSLDKLAESVPTTTELNTVVNNLQEQIDGAIETFTSEDIPLLSNYPASDWKDDDTRKKHIGDVLYVVNAGSTADGHCYRFAQDKNGQFEWVLIKDSDVTKVLQELIDINGDISALQTFESTTRSWQTSTDQELSSIKTTQTNFAVALEETGKTIQGQTTMINEVRQSAAENASTITTLTNKTEELDGSIESVGNSVNAVKQTADANTLSISNLSKTVDGNKTEVESKYTELTQTIDGFRQTVSKTEETVGHTVVNIELEYALSDSEKTPPITGWSATPPVWENNKFMWMKIIKHYGDETTNYSTSCISGAQGSTGIQGVPGEPGPPTYIHVKYSNDGSTFTSTNLLTDDVDKWVNGYFTSNTTLDTSEPDTGLSNFDSISLVKVYNVTPGESYILESGDDSIRIVLTEYDENGTGIASVFHNNGTVVTIPNDVYHVRFTLQALGKFSSLEGWTNNISLGLIKPNFANTNSEVGDVIGAYIGTYTSLDPSPSLNPKDYTWVKFTEDMDNTIADIYKTLSDQRTDIISDCTSIVLSATETLVQTGDYENFKQTVEAQLRIMSNEIVASFNTATNRISEVDNDAQSKFTELYKYISMSDRGIVIGSGDNAIELQLDSDAGIAFSKNGEIFGEWDGENFYTGNIMIEVTKRAQFGNFAFVPRSDGSLSFLKVGEIVRPVRIVEQPTNTIASGGGIIDFAISVSGSVKSYAWEVSSNGSDFSKCSNGSLNYNSLRAEVIGAESNRCMLNINNSTPSGQWYFRCEITDSNDAVLYSNIVRLDIL